MLVVTFDVHAGVYWGAGLLALLTLMCGATYWLFRVFLRRDLRLMIARQSIGLYRTTRKMLLMTAELPAPDHRANKQVADLAFQTVDTLLESAKIGGLDGDVIQLLRRFRGRLQLALGSEQQRSGGSHEDVIKSVKTALFDLLYGLDNYKLLAEVEQEFGGLT